MIFFFRKLFTEQINFWLVAIRYFIFFVPIVFLAAGCVPQYGLRNPFGDKIYFEKMAPYSNQSLNFIGGNVYHSSDSGATNANELNYGFNVYFGRSFSYKDWQASIGFFGYNGKYKMSVPGFNGWKPYYGAGVTIESALSKFNSAYFNNFTCVKTTLNYEDGAYYRNRKEAEKQYLLYNLSPGKYSINLSLGNDFIFTWGNKKAGFYFSGGPTIDLGTKKSVLILCSNLHFTVNSSTFYLQYTFHEISFHKTIWVGYAISFMQ